MKKYLKHLFSWKEQATRKEWFGFALLMAFPPALHASFFIINKLFVSSNSLEILSIIFLFINLLFFAGLLILATLRRLNHIGISRFWVFLLVLCFFPYLKVIGFLFLLFLLFVPPFRNPDPQNHKPTYLLFHSLLLVFCFLLFVIVLIIGSSPVFSEVRQKMKDKSDQQNLVSFSGHTFPPYTNTELIFRYKGQNTPAFLSGQEIPSDKPNGVPSVHWTWDVPDTVSVADKTDWDTQHIDSCGNYCKKMFSVDKTKVMHILWSTNEKRWMQSISNKQGLIERISFKQSPRKWVMFLRYQNKEAVQAFLNNPNGSVRFFDAGLQNIPLFPSLEGEPSKLLLDIFPDGTLIPTMISTENSEHEVHYPKEKFAQHWSGVNPSDKWLEMMFPYQRTHIEQI